MQAFSPRPVVFIDNYDSFTYNLVDLVARHTRVEVFRNDAITVEEVLAMQPAGLVISPGPGRPEDSGVNQALLSRLPSHLPALGVCLGHQLMGQWTGGTVKLARRPMHGKTSDIVHDGRGIFRNLAQPLRVMRYHSLLLDAKTLPVQWSVAARTVEGEIMAVRHRERPWVGVQFHPESILTQQGDRMLENWLSLTSIV